MALIQLRACAIVVAEEDEDVLDVEDVDDVEDAEDVDDVVVVVAVVEQRGSQCFPIA